MKKVAAILGFAAFSAMTAAAGQWTGYISDSKCASENAKASAAADWIKPAMFESCAKMCVKNGSPAVFLTPENRTIRIDAASLEKATALLGHKVTVTGKIDDGVLKIDTIAEAK